jgi:hypothetical protein
MRQAGDWYMSFFVEITPEITPKCRMGKIINYQLSISEMLRNCDRLFHSFHSCYC